MKQRYQAVLAVGQDGWQVSEVARRLGVSRQSVYARISVDNELFSVTNGYKGELVDVFVDETTIQVWSKNHLIRSSGGT